LRSYYEAWRGLVTDRIHLVFHRETMKQYRGFKEEQLKGFIILAFSMEILIFGRV